MLGQYIYVSNFNGWAGTKLINILLEKMLFVSERNIESNFYQVWGGYDPNSRGFQSVQFGIPRFAWPAKDVMDSNFPYSPPN